MITAVDTNILLDVLAPGEPHAESSEQALEESLRVGPIVISEPCILIYGRDRPCEPWSGRCQTVRQLGRHVFSLAEPEQLCGRSSPYLQGGASAGSVIARRGGNGRRRTICWH